MRASLILLQTVYDDYKTRLTAGNLTQSSRSYENDPAYNLDISLFPRYADLSLYTISSIQSRAVGWLWGSKLGVF